jgi:hypothetical protein
MFRTASGNMWGAHARFCVLSTARLCRGQMTGCAVVIRSAEWIIIAGIFWLYWEVYKVQKALADIKLHITIIGSEAEQTHYKQERAIEEANSTLWAIEHEAKERERLQSQASQP